jgi:hypothetical protein
MVRTSRVGHLTSTHTFLTPSWTAAVASMETAILRFPINPRAPSNDCQVVFFEIAHDAHLHVNVTHKYPTREVEGWAGPADTADGFVHNRVFGDATPGQIVRHIRKMVFAPRT